MGNCSNFSKNLLEKYKKILGITMPEKFSELYESHVICDLVCKKMLELKIHTNEDLHKFIFNYLLTKYPLQFINHFEHYFTNKTIRNFTVNNLNIKSHCLGNTSANGVILVSEYDVETIRLPIIIKHSLKMHSDNIYYEYLVGLCVNEFSKHIPFFSKTYGIYEYNQGELQTIISTCSSESINKNYIFNIEKIHNINVTNLEKHILKSCSSNNYGVVTENIDVYSTFNEFIHENITYSKILNYITSETIITGSTIKYLYRFYEAFNILTLVYATLHKFKLYFTHYDLHSNNVLLTRVPDNKYIEVIVDDNFTIKTQYLPIIIDYGRCYINCKLMNSTKALKTVCELKNPVTKNNICYNNCGDYTGYTFVGYYDGEKFDNTRSNKHFINLANKNMSHDLRLLQTFKKFIDKYKILTYDTQIDSSVKTNITTLLNNLVYTHEFGTREVEESVANKIYNVSDAYTKLKELISDVNFTKVIDTNFIHKNSIGKLNIYIDIHKKYEIFYNL